MACCIEGCSSRRDKNAASKKSFFTAYTTDMFISWSNVLSTKNMKLTKKSPICELHFKAEEIVREDAFSQDNGEIIYIKRTKPKLKEGAVPSIFPPKKIQYYQYYKCKSIDGMSSEVSSETSHAVEEKPISKFSAQNLSCGNSIEMPATYWFANINEDYMMWSCWASDLSHILRRAILTPNMKLQVFIANKGISFNSTTINNIHQIKSILLELQNFFPCESINDEDRVTNCKGFIINRHCKKIQRMRCLPCQKKWKNLLRKEHRK